VQTVAPAPDGLELRAGEALRSMRAWMARLEDHRKLCADCERSLSASRGTVPLCPVGDELSMRYCRAYFARHQAETQLRKRHFQVARLTPAAPARRSPDVEEELTAEPRQRRQGANSEFPTLVKRYPCPECGARSGESCTSFRLHEQRIALFKRSGRAPQRR
jgi:predicted RNA-binding Zn-ribbon protein involved in translation (DUF1610 family)